MMRARKSGVVLFVVMGGIFVLTILVLAYNHLVQGKFNESREILKHLRALKTAQAVSRFVITKMKSDLSDASSTDTNSAGYLLRTKVFVNNDPKKLSETIKKVWLDKIDFNALVKRLFGEYPMKDVSVSYDISFSDVTPLSTLKKDNELFLEFEKAGKMTVSIDIFIGNTRESWQEARPFRVVVPFPMPLTKFTMYLRDATGGDPVKFNTVTIDAPSSGNIAQGSPRPFILDNGYPGDQFNSQAEIWKKRGWIYFGGGEALLNRAASHRKFGQRYHSYYPDTENPITLLLNFSNFDGEPVNGHNLVFRIARWGFSDALLNGPSADMWSKILEYQSREHKPSKDKRWWQSTCLHLFGEAGQTSSDRRISITRVAGKVSDHFLELSYLIPASGNEPPVGAVIHLEKKFYDKYSGKKRNIIPGKLQDIGKTFMKDVFVDKNLIYPAAPPDAVLGVPNLQELGDFFAALPYFSTGGNISYYEIMSKVATCSYSETYNLIFQYTKDNQNINIPPPPAVPETNDMEFGLPVMGIDCEKLKIDQIAAAKDTTIGLSKRVCYEINPGKGEDAFQLLKNNFCMAKNSDFNLANAVVRVKTGGKGLKMGNDLGSNTGGTVIVDGPVEVGTFRIRDSAEKAPLMIMAEKGAITVRNTGQHPVLAYLVALDKTDGQIKTTSSKTPLNLLGGIAAHTLDPDALEGGGTIIYNQNLDPTADAFGANIGVVIGPPGGEK